MNMTKQNRSQTKAPQEMTPAEVIIDLHQFLTTHVRIAVDNFLRPRNRQLRMSTVSLEHDAECFNEHGKMMLTHLATKPFRSEGDFAKWLIERWRGLQAEHLHLYQTSVTDEDHARIYRGLDIIEELWKMRYRHRYWSVSQEIIESLQLVVDNMSTPVDTLVFGAPHAN